MTQTFPFTPIKPTTWGAAGNWGTLPVLAFPCRHGWALWEAIRERLYYLYPTPEHVLPPALLPIIGEYDANADYKHIERVMYETLMWLLPRYYDLLAEGNPNWTLERALAALKEDTPYAPVPHYLSARWLWQAYKIVNLLRAPPFLISMTFIDESSPYAGVTPSRLYAEDKAMFEREVADTTAVFHVATPGGALDPITDGPAPANVLYRTVRRGNAAYATDVQTLKDTFILLRKQFEHAPDSVITLGLFIDASGSMGLSDISGIINGFLGWLSENYAITNIEQRLAGNERWLYWTAAYIAEIERFSFTANVRPPADS